MEEIGLGRKQMQTQANYYTCHWIGPVILKRRARLCRAGRQAGRAARKKEREFISLTQGTRPHVPLTAPTPAGGKPRRPRRGPPPRRLTHGRRAPSELLREIYSLPSRVPSILAMCYGAVWSTATISHTKLRHATVCGGDFRRHNLGVEMT
jgi:hypothetical protein